MPRLASVCLALALGLFGFSAAAEEKPDPNRQVIAKLRKALEKNPDNPTLHYYLAAFQARAKERDGAIASLKKTLELGDGFMPLANFGFEHLQDDAEFKQLLAAFETRLPKAADAPVVFRLDDKLFFPEGIAYDARTESFYVGSIPQKRIVRINANGKITPFSRAEDGLQHILGIAIDQPRRLLYAVSTSALTEAGRKLGVNAVVRYDLDSGKRGGEQRFPQAQQLNDVAIAPNGDVYASDTRAGAIWRAGAGSDAATPFLAPGILDGINGIAIAADGKTLYAAHDAGVAAVDIGTGQVTRLATPARETVAAIDGLYVWNGDLVGIQNITNRGRVIRIRLNEAGTAITRIDTLQSHHQPAFEQPTTAAIAGDALYVLATTQIARLKLSRPEGPEHPETLKLPAVVRVPLVN